MEGILFKLFHIKAEPERCAELYFKQFEIGVKRGVAS